MFITFEFPFLTVLIGLEAAGWEALHSYYQPSRCFPVAWGTLIGSQHALENVFSGPGALVYSIR